MEALSAKEARLWCRGFNSLRLSSEDVLEYKGRRRHSFVVKFPARCREIVAVAHTTLLFTDGRDFEGGLGWLKRWDIGTNQITRVGWRTVEDIRRAHGCVESLEVAPAQAFRHDEFVELHAVLAQMMAYGWGGYFVPRVRGYFLDIRTSERFFCKAESAATLEKLHMPLKDWGPSPASRRQ
jgi:hypothetical protein